jgi:acyl-coenzyme A synthetase/AMP-(fatty) acid ligase
MESSPEYVCLWFGLSKIGVISALINNNLQAETLVHSIKVSNCTAIIIGKEQINGKYTYIVLIYLRTSYNEIFRLYNLHMS